MDNPKILLFHPTGTVIYAQQTARAYYEARFLDKFFLTFAYRPKSAFGELLKGVSKLFGIADVGELNRRKITEVPDYVVKTRPALEVLRTLSGKYLGPIPTDFVWERCEHDFSKYVRNKLHKKLLAVHGYEHGSLEVFKKARQMGIKTIYEMPAPFHKVTTRILEAEFEKFPQAVTAYKKYTDRLSPKRNRRREEELALSDIIVCNSSFTADSLVEFGVSKDKIIIIPYGMPEVDLTNSPQYDKEKIVFLYVGTLSVRKGAHYLLEAWRKLDLPKNVELRMFGAVNINPDLLKNLPENVTISKTIPRAELQGEYKKAHLLIFPTLCDGFGMVLSESLAGGCPVLTTENAGSSSFIKEGENGFVIPAGNEDALLEKLRWSARNSSELIRMREKALQTALGWQWADYRKLFIVKIKNILQI